MGIDYRVRQGYCMNFTLQLFLFGIHTPWTIINSKQIGPHSTTVHQEHSILKVDFFYQIDSICSTGTVGGLQDPGLRVRAHDRLHRRQPHQGRGVGDGHQDDGGRDVRGLILPPCPNFCSIGVDE